MIAKFTHQYLGNLDRFPLLVVHMLLANAERELDDAIRRRGTEDLQRWEAVKSPGDLDRIYVDRDLTRYYQALAVYACEREQMEIDALLAGRAA